MITRNYYKEIKDINELPPKGWLLDIGCGNGRFSEPFHKEGFDCVLVDSEEKYSSNFGKRFKADLNMFMFGSMDEQFEIVIANNVLFHLKSKDFKVALDNIYRVLKKGGVFIGTFVGCRDEWAQGKDAVIAQTRKEANNLLKQYEILNFQEIDAKLGLLTGGLKKWHRFEFTVKK